MRFFYLLFFISNSISFAQSFNVAGGYFPYWRSVDGVDFSNYNYLYYAFVIPATNGEVQLAGGATSAFDSFKSATASVSAKRLISVGSTNCAVMANDAIARKNFASELRIFCRTHDFDGIDMDWEAIDNTIDQVNFTALMKDIRNEIDTTDLEFVITVGFGNYWMQWYEDEALQQADFLQIMVYDQTGTWPGSPYGNHASMDHYTQAETYWVGRGYSRDKLVMGLPYYGYKFTNTSGGLAEAVTYADILTQFPNATSADNLLSNNTGYYWFNGVDLIKQKINYAKENGFKGVFVWEIAQDDFNHLLSLNKAFGESIALSNEEITPADKNINYIFNYSQNTLFIQSYNTLGEVSIYSAIGIEVYHEKTSNNQLQVPLDAFAQGIYFIKSSDVFIGKTFKP